MNRGVRLDAVQIEGGPRERGDEPTYRVIDRRFELWSPRTRG